MAIPRNLSEALSRRLLPIDAPISSLPLGGYRRTDVDRQRPAAVLVGLTEEDVPHVLLTVRALHLVRHAGQVAFPGGAREDRDRSVVETALREAREETGLSEHQVRPLGYLGRYDTVTGYRMTAVVALIDPAFSPRPDRNEVEQVFRVPLSRISDPACYRAEHVRLGTQRFEVLTLEHPEHRIWGATAALLHDLGRRIAGPAFDD